MNALLDRILVLAVQIQQIAAPTFAEEARARFVMETFQAEGLTQVAMGAEGNVYACLAGNPASHRPLVLSAHLDTVFPAACDLAVRRAEGRISGPGIGDNSLGVAGLLGAVWLLRASGTQLPCDLWLVANTCEEGLGDLRGMKAVVERFGSEPQAYVILEGMGLGHIYHRGLGVRRYRIEVLTEGGHSWIDHGRPSAIHELAHLVTRLTRLELPHTPRTTLNVGVISGGTSVNTIAAQAHLELDLRSEGPAALEALAAEVERLCAQALRPGAEVKAQVIGNRPAGEIAASHPLVARAEETLRAAGVTPRLAIGSTDANIPLSLNLPAITLGLTSGEGAHTGRETIQCEPLEKGMAALVALLMQFPSADG